MGVGGSLPITHRKKEFSINDLKNCKDNKKSTTTKNLKDLSSPQMARRKPESVQRTSSDPTRMSNKSKSKQHLSSSASYDQTFTYSTINHSHSLYSKTLKNENSTPTDTPPIYPPRKAKLRPCKSLPLQAATGLVKSPTPESKFSRETRFSNIAEEDAPFNEHSDKRNDAALRDTSSTAKRNNNCAQSAAARNMYVNDDKTRSTNAAVLCTGLRPKNSEKIEPINASKDRHQNYAAFYGAAPNGSLSCADDSSQAGRYLRCDSFNYINSKNFNTTPVTHENSSVNRDSARKNPRSRISQNYDIFGDSERSIRVDPSKSRSDIDDVIASYSTGINGQYEWSAVKGVSMNGRHTRDDVTVIRPDDGTKNEITKNDVAKNDVTKNDVTASFLDSTVGSCGSNILETEYRALKESFREAEHNWLREKLAVLAYQRELQKKYEEIRDENYRLKARLRMDNVVPNLI